jgi:protein ImuB
MPVACAIAPRFRLLAAVGEQREMLARPAALAPEPGAAQLIGEVSEPAEALGLRPGMRLGEALSRCPELALVPADPERADVDWEGVLSRLEGIGAEVESERAGEAFFETTGLHNLWGDTAGVLARARREVGSPARLAAAPGRFCSYVAARRAPASRSPIVAEGSAREFLAPLPVSLLCGRLRPPAAGAARADDDAEADDLPNQLERLGIDTLGRLAGLPRDAVADRFGLLGLQALRLAGGRDWPLRPRRVREGLAVELELPEAVSGPQLERALELLIARLLAHRERRGRSVRALRLSARLAAGGGWRRDVALRRAGTERDRLAAALLPQLALLPGPAITLRLEAVALGSASGEQLTLADPEEQRRRRISEAVHQARAAGGSEAVLRVLEVDPDSRVPERRDVLMPWVEGAPQMGGRATARPVKGRRSNPFGEEEA